MKTFFALVGAIVLFVHFFAAIGVINLHVCVDRSGKCVPNDLPKGQE